MILYPVPSRWKLARQRCDSSLMMEYVGFTHPAFLSHDGICRFYTSCIFLRVLSPPGAASGVHPPPEYVQTRLKQPIYTHTLAMAEQSTSQESENLEKCFDIVARIRQNSSACTSVCIIRLHLMFPNAKQLHIREFFYWPE